MSVVLRIGSEQIGRVRSHLFRDDRDEHAAVLLVGRHSGPGRERLLTREVHLLGDDEFPAGEHGYRQIAAAALARLGNRAFERGLGLLTVHSHPLARERVALSREDLQGHSRIFEHLLDIVGSPVGGVAMGQSSADGEIWLGRDRVLALERVEAIGEHAEVLRAAPLASAASANGRHDRQVRLFGAAGQERLRSLRVAVVGLGGGGSLVVEQLAHLGVGEIVAIDFDRVAEHNLSRIVGAGAQDAERRAKKTEVAERLVARIDDSVRVTAIDGDVVDSDVAEQLIACDFVVLATDTHSSRLVVNAIAHAYLIPTVQIGAKVDVRADGSIEQIYCALRPILPPHGCLHCAHVIDPVALQRETATEEERVAQDYLGRGSGVIDPSVISLNAVGAAAAMNVLLLSAVGLGQPGLGAHRIHTPADGRWMALQVQRDSECPWCSLADHSQYALGDRAALPVKLAQRPRERGSAASLA